MASQFVLGVARDPTERIVDLQPAIIHGDERHAVMGALSNALSKRPRSTSLQAPPGLQSPGLEPLALGDYFAGGCSLADASRRSGQLVITDPAQPGRAGRCELRVVH